MMKLLAIAAVGEALFGAVVLVYPPIVVRLLFGAEIGGVGVVMGRIAGISLIALGVACWPGGAADRALSAMLTWGTLITLYLGYLGVGGKWTGSLLWPAIVLHAGLTVLLASAWFGERQARVR